MARTAKDITDAELSVLQVLWERGGCSVRQICDVLYPAGGPSPYATVQKLLQRLEAKGFVRRDRGSPVQLFHAALSRDALIAQRLRNLAERLCGGSLTPLLTNLVRSRPLSPQEREALKALIEGSPEQPGKRPRNRHD
jgi:predicted transcriptional regulator